MRWEPLARLLRPGGLLYCAVPDVEGLADCPNAPFQQFSAEHVNFFSWPARLERLVAGAGMAPRRIVAMDRRMAGRGHRADRKRRLYARPDPGLGIDAATRPALERYVAVSREGDARMIAAIEALRATQEPLVVWGAGTLARRLLATTRFAEANILAFVDRIPTCTAGALPAGPSSRGTRGIPAGVMSWFAPLPLKGRSPN